MFLSLRRVRLPCPVACRAMEKALRIPACRCVSFSSRHMLTCRS